MNRDTVFSPCNCGMVGDRHMPQCGYRKYRYSLWREFHNRESLFGSDFKDGFIQFIGLNPSVADETQDDPTIRRCVSFSKQWGYGAMCMTNLFAWRDTDPKEMKKAPAPIGMENNEWIIRIAKEAALVIAAWGKHGSFMNRGRDVVALLNAHDITVHCIRKNGDGSPEHPLYLPSDLKPIPFIITENKSSALIAFGHYLRDHYLMLRRTRTEVGLELPKVQRIVHQIEYDDEVLVKIRGEATELAHIILRSTDFHEKGEAARKFDLKLRMATGIAKAPYVAEFVRELVNEGQKVLLFGWHRDVYDIWMRRLHDLRPVLYTGSESPAEKEQSLRSFTAFGSMVMMMSLRSAVGVDGIQKVCCTNVFGELDWSPGVHDQGEGRTNRDGAIGPVSSYFLVADVGSDPPMAEVLGLKTAQVQGILKATDDGQTFTQTDLNRVKLMAEQYLSHKP